MSQQQADKINYYEIQLKEQQAQIADLKSTISKIGLMDLNAALGHVEELKAVLFNTIPFISSNFPTAKAEIRKVLKTK